MTEIKGDKNRAAAAMAVVKAWKDPAFEARLMRETTETLREEGVEIPPGTKVVPLRQEPTLNYIVLPPGAGPEKVEEVMEGLGDQLLPLPPGGELRIVQATEETTYFVLPRAPEGGVPRAATGPGLEAAGVGPVIEAVVLDTTEAVNIETTLDLAAETNVAGVAEVVAVAVGVLI